MKESTLSWNDALEIKTWREGALGRGFLEFLQRSALALLQSFPRKNVVFIYWSEFRRLHPGNAGKGADASPIPSLMNDRCVKVIDFCSGCIVCASLSDDGRSPCWKPSSIRIDDHLVPRLIGGRTHHNRLDTSKWFHVFALQLLCRSSIY